MPGDNLEHNYLEATVRTAGDLRNVATTMELLQLSQLTLPEVERITQEVARIVPAGNVPGLILNGLAMRINDRTVEPTEARKHIGLLFKGVKVALDKAFYSTFFLGPAAVLHAYQQILRLAGKDPETAFPEGTWQFYLEFALREDTARHANETTGFHDKLASNRLKLSEADQMVSWLLAIANLVNELPEVLANEWRERVMLRLLIEAGRNPSEYRGMLSKWEYLKPYTRETLRESYAAFRRRSFEMFWNSYAERLPRNARQDLETRLHKLESSAMPAYQHQMSWLAYLQSDVYNESRVHYPIEQAQIGVIWQGRYFLIPLLSLTDPVTARRVAASILKAPQGTPAELDDLLVILSRDSQPAVRAALSSSEQMEIERLRRAPVLLNWDQQRAGQPLSFVRRCKRGIGDHPLTLIRTDESMVFDQSHIFFDGGWGAAVAQILTNEALMWGNYVSQITAPTKTTKVQDLYTPKLAISPKVTAAAKKGRLGSVPEAAAENTTVQLKTIMSLRKALKQRSDLAQVTVNDLFILYRGIHAISYEPSQGLQNSLAVLVNDRRSTVIRAYQAVKDALERGKGKNPAILIPIDASLYDPRERVFPTTFWNPLTDFVRVHQETMQAYEKGGSRPEFEKKQAEYLRLVGGFGELLSRYKEIAARGQSPSTLSIKALAHLPAPLQQLFSNLPGKFDVLNEVLKGEEVFSNVGRVAPNSTLRRFITAKDDNEQKTFCWGVITDDSEVIHLSLRDFRPHVKLLADMGLANLAQLMVQDYLDSYAAGLNRYITELRDITLGSVRQTGPLRGLFGL